MNWLKPYLIKVLLVGAVILLTAYLFFRAYYINFSPYVAVFSVVLFIAEFHTILLMYGMLYSLWPRNYPKFPKANTNKDLQINLFVTVAGEPTEIVRETIIGAKQAALYYQHTHKPNKLPRVIVLNDGKAANKDNWQEIAAICKEQGVYHVARETNEGYKAGNINNGLKEFPADDPHNTIDCFFDADFAAKENFLPEILKPLADDSIDFVQTPQRYKNLNTWVAEAAGAHQIFFFDYICPAKAYDNALFLCGTNYAIRRKALLDAGGVDNRFVTEDYATSIRLHLQGKKGVFLPKVLALGLAPMNLKEYFNQQMRWCKGCLDANAKYFKALFFGPLTLRQKFHYFLSTAYYFIGIRDLILILAPIPYLFFGISLIRANTLEYLAFVYLPLMIFNFILFFLTFRSPIKSLVLDLISFPIFATAFISCVIKKNLPFTITIKKYEKENPFKVYRVQLIVALALIAGLIYSLVMPTQANIYGRLINYFWAMYSAVFLVIGFFLVARENYSFRVALPTFLQIRPVHAYQFARVSFVALSVLITGLFSPTINDYVTSVNDRLQLQKYVQASTGNQELLVPEEGVYYGYYLPNLNTHPRNGTTQIVPGEKTSLVMYYQDWGDEKLFDRRFMDSLSQQNVIPVITWEPWDVKETQKGNSMQEAYSPKVIASGKYDDYIRRFAREAAAYKKPYFLRFAHEMNGNWYPWGDIESNTPQDYIAMWVHVHKIFEEEGATNTIWVWSPNSTDVHGTTDTVMKFYPGAAYVDWVAYSGFNWGDTQTSQWMSFKDLSRDIYGELETLNKPIMVAETSSVSRGDDKALWFRQTVKELPTMPKIKAVVFFNENFKDSDFKLSSGMDVKQVFREIIVTNTYFIQQPDVVTRETTVSTINYPMSKHATEMIQEAIIL
jgi:cellulose synthase (UDP-forming)